MRGQHENNSQIIIIYISHSCCDHWSTLLGLAIQLDQGCRLSNYQCMYRKHYCNHLLQIKGVLISPINSLHFSMIWGMQCGKKEFHEFHRLGTGQVYQIFYSRTKKNAKTPTIFTGKQVKFMEISLETVIWGNYYVNIAFALNNINQGFRESLH